MKAPHIYLYIQRVQSTAQYLRAWVLEPGCLGSPLSTALTSYVTCGKLITLRVNVLICKTGEKKKKEQYLLYRVV